jgi:hypothetical protein
MKKTLIVIAACAGLVLSAAAVPTFSFVNGVNQAALTPQPSGSDLAEGLTAVVSQGGFHPANFNDLSQLTNESTNINLGGLTGGGSGSNCILPNDFPGVDIPTITLDFDLGPLGANITAINVFTGNQDGRVFQHYDVSTSNDNVVYTPLISDVISAAGFPTGLSNGAADARTVTSVVDSLAGTLVTARYVRLAFYAVDNTATAFVDTFPTGNINDTDGIGGVGPGTVEAVASSVIREIDIIGVTVPAELSTFSNE